MTKGTIVPSELLGESKASGGGLVKPPKVAPAEKKMSNTKTTILTHVRQGVQFMYRAGQHCELPFFSSTIKPS